jgi:hypothetical protein
MHPLKAKQFLSRPMAAGWVLLIFLAYLVYLPIHAFSVEHCLPGVVHADDATHDGDAAHDDEAEGPAGHSHHQHADGSHHHQHHTAKDHEVESTGKISVPQLISTAQEWARLRLSNPSVILFTGAVETDVSFLSFSPGHWLITRGPPRF